MEQRLARDAGRPIHYRMQQGGTGRCYTIATSYDNDRPIIGIGGITSTQKLKLARVL